MLRKFDWIFETKKLLEHYNRLFKFKKKNVSQYNFLKNYN